MPTFPIYLRSHVSIGLTYVLQASGFAINTETLVFGNHVSMISVTVTVDVKKGDIIRQISVTDYFVEW